MTDYLVEFQERFSSKWNYFKIVSSSDGYSGAVGILNDSNTATLPHGTKIRIRRLEPGLDFIAETVTKTRIVSDEDIPF
jgi:hypothetical protein